MKEFLRDNKWMTLLFIIGAVYFFLAYIAPLLTPILLAFLFVTMFGPLLKKMQRRLRIPRQVSVVLLLLLVTIVLGVTVWLVISWATANAAGFGTYLETWEKEMQLIIGSVCNWVGRTFSVDVSHLEESVSELTGQLLGRLQSDSIPRLVDSLVRYTKTLVSGGAFLITFLIGAILLAKDYDKYMNVLLEQRECHVWLEALCGTIRYIVSFIKAQLTIMGMIAGTIALVLFLAGIPNGLLWGLLAGALDVLPFVGTGIVLLPLILIQLAKGAYGRAVVCGLLYGGCVLIREFLEPRIVGKKMGVWPVAVLTSIYVGIQLFGLAGVVKGPLGFVLVYQIFRSFMTSVKGTAAEEISEKQELNSCKEH